MQQKQVMAADGVTLSYRVLGQGPAVMLMHGFTQWSQMWIDNGVAQALSPRFRLIMPDRRGHGHSGQPPHAADYGMRMVDDVFTILDAEGQQTAHLVGYSQGSELAWRAALERPERVLSTYLIASGWPGPELDLALQAYASIVDWLPKAMAKGAPWLPPNPDLAVFTAIAASMGAVLDVSEATMAALAVPAAGLAGADDAELSTMQRLAQLLPDFNLQVLPQTDHLGSSLYPGLAQAIEAFVTQAATPEGA